MSAELVETSRLWARVNAKVEPEWIEPLAGHLLKRTYSEPHWEKDQAAVMAFERVTLYGVPIVAQRKVNFGRIDQEASRDLFIRNALVEGDWRTHHQFFHDNRKLLGEVEELEHRARRRDILVDDETLFDFYDQRIPEHVVSGAHFDSWWKNKKREEPDALDFERSMLINEKAGAVTKDDYPDSWRQGKLKFKVTYQFEPGADADGVTVHVPLQVLNQVTSEGFDWQIPGLREEVVTELIRSLPKPIHAALRPRAELRRQVPRPGGPAPGAAAAHPGAGAPADGRRAGHGRRLRPLPGPGPPEDHVPDRRRAAAEGRRGQGPGGAEAPAAAEGPAGALQGGRGDRGAVRRVHRAVRAHRLDDRHAEQGLRDASCRAAGQGLSGPRRPGRHRGRTPLRHRGRAAAGDVARHPCG